MVQLSIIILVGGGVYMVSIFRGGGRYENLGVSTSKKFLPLWDIQSYAPNQCSDSFSLLSLVTFFLEGVAQGSTRTR